MPDPDAPRLPESPAGGLAKLGGVVRGPVAILAVIAVGLVVTVILPAAGY
jgi:hypothetical protein